MVRFVGIDVGAETLKAVELVRDGGAPKLGRRALVEHHKEPGRRLVEILGEWSWESVTGAAVTGRLGRQVQLTRIPLKQALAAGKVADLVVIEAVRLAAHERPLVPLRRPDPLDRPLRE